MSQLISEACESCLKSNSVCCTINFSNALPKSPKAYLQKFRIFECFRQVSDVNDTSYDFEIMSDKESNVYTTLFIKTTTTTTATNITANY